MAESVLVACNTLTSIQTPAYADHTRFWYRMGKEFPKLNFHQLNARRVSIDRFRNNAFLIAARQKMDYLLFIDDDMQFDYKIFRMLYDGCKKEKYDILAALNYIRGYPFDPMAFKFSKDEERKRLVFLTDEEIDGAQGKIVPCEAIGTAVCLINMKRLRDIPAPWFITGPHNTEDIYFCCQVRHYLKKAKIGVHTGAITGHLLDAETLSYFTRPKLLKYFESYMTPEQIEGTKNQDRGLAYISENILPMITSSGEEKK